MAAQNVGISIAPETIGHLLKEENLRVPLSQRSYRWEDEHVVELYQDVNGAIRSNADEYFVGSIVGINSEGTVQIYDGQQRLATTMILIAAIRDYFHASKDPKTAFLVQDEFLISADRKTHEEKEHFSLNAEDRQFFHDRILLPPDDKLRGGEKPQRESNKRIIAAAKIAADFVRSSIVAGLPSDQVPDQLHRWLDFITKSLRVIWVQVGDERTAFTLFETMNDRGLRLSAADLLKNRLYAMGEDRRDEIIQKWQSMTGTLETIEGEAENVVEYVRCFWITRHGHTRTKFLYDEIKKETTNKTKALALASDLEAGAQDYAAILLSSHETWASRSANVRAKIEVTRELGVTQIRPLLLAAFRKFSPKEFEKLLDACVSWSVRTIISGVPSGTLEGYYSRNALEITKGNFRNAAQVKAQMVKIIPDDARFKVAVASANVAREQLARYYLRALQGCADGEKEPQYIPNPGREVTLEHILPKNPGKDWNNFTAEEQKTFLNRLGNQVLLPATVNSKIGNESYAVKKSALAASQFTLTNETAAHVQWGTAEIIARQQRLAALAIRTWPLNA
jgi:hypothetical protein